MHNQISNADVMDAVKKAFGFRTDLEVAGFLNISKDNLSKIRRGKKPLAIKQRLKIMDRLATIQIRDLLMKISPEYLARELYRLSHRDAETLAFDVNYPALKGEAC